MFSLDEETRTFWFNLNTMESEEDFRLVGRLIGLAVHNAVILDVRFPSVLYKKLCPGLAKPVGFEVASSLPAFPLYVARLALASLQNAGIGETYVNLVRWLALCRNVCKGGEEKCAGSPGSCLLTPLFDLALY